MKINGLPLFWFCSHLVPYTVQKQIKQNSIFFSVSNVHKTEYNVYHIQSTNFRATIDE